MSRLLVVALGIITAAAVAGISFTSQATLAQTAPTPNPGCSPDVVPVGQANPPGSQLEPLAPIWCFTPLAAPNAPGRVTGANDWSDNFDNVAQSGRFNDGDYDYRVFPSVQSSTGFQSMHFTNNGHWMDDNAGGGQGGTMIRPNRSFKFENGKLVVEQDVAANISGYAGDAWPEIEISNQPQPTVVTWDNLYAYGQFGGPGSWTIGCRLTNPVCAIEGPQLQPDIAPAPSNCFETAQHRVMEISFFEQCGSKHFGGEPGIDPQHFARACSSAAQEPDMVCRDRFRIELTASDLKYYINGFLYFEDGNWPASRQIDPNAIANQQWYVYAADWEDTHPSPAYRFHWDNFVVNPHNPDGTFRAPSAASNFCLGQPGNVCPMTMATATPVVSTPVPPTSTAVPPTNTATATPTRTVTPAATSTTVPATATSVPDGTCSVVGSLNGTPTTYTRPLVFCTNQ
jgi:hypothetical protein